MTMTLTAARRELRDARKAWRRAPYGSKRTTWDRFKRARTALMLAEMERARG